MRILVVEDDEALAAFLRRGLEGEGYGVDVAADGDEAHRMAIAYAYDLIILDLNLPRMHGVDVLKRLREKKSLCSRAHPDGADPGRGSRAGLGLGRR